MTSGVLDRPVHTIVGLLLGLSVVLGVTFCSTDASADPIVLENSSIIGAVASVTSNGSSLFDSYLRQRLPVSGAGTLSDTRTVTSGGATATVSGSVMTDLASNRIGGTGQIHGTTESTTSSLAAIDGQTDLKVVFTLGEPHAFNYEGQFFVEKDLCATCFLMDGGFEISALLRSETTFALVFNDSLFFNPTGGVQRHSGVLAPGTYGLTATAFADFIAVPSTRQDLVLTFATALELSPVSSTPEPMTFALFGTGLVGMAGRARSRRKIVRRPRRD